jgi:hypothetical protein
MGSVATSKVKYEEGFLIYEEMRKNCTINEETISLVIFDFATAPF